MVKTKRATRVSSVKPEATKSTVSRVSQSACDGACWLCWLFKLMIVMFVVMVVFWLGFCFGALSIQTPGFKINDRRMMSYGQPVPSAPMKLNAENFDQEFLSQMILNHQEAIDMAKLALEKTTNETIKAMCQGIIDNQTKELDQLKAQQ
jgi:predicted outer membrane protein